ncbi:hypothetical protein SLS56_011061 [Neofusicoccum ribis]|uniref:Secreted protein n=1 Tax=Neofusicoccum ribis TaxID=45134 RepID=A0ABR3SDC0_9PEZI
MNKTLVAENIQDAGAIGAGGVEFIPYYGYGGTIDTYFPESNWSKNGFGTPAFLEMFQTALEAHKSYGMVMDFALGPNQGQGVPAESNDEGLQWDLASHSSVVPTNGSFSGVIPGWGDGQLVALVSALVLSETNVTISGSSFPPPEYTSYSRLTLSQSSLKDITSRVPTSGHVSLNFNSSTNGARHQLFAFYERRTLAKNLNFPYNDTETIFDNGSYSVDHFSVAGARTVSNFWKKYVLKDEIKKLLIDVGNYGKHSDSLFLQLLVLIVCEAWEDSIELVSNTSWTPAIPAKFEKKYGYSILPFLPLIMWGNNNLVIQPSGPGRVQCLLDSDDAGQGYVNDYRAILQDCYREYLEEMRAWIHDDLNLQVSAQVSYNMPMDAAASIPYTDAPECESLQWDNNVDGYRQFTGAAHLAGKRVISNELGAERSKAYQLTIPHMLWSINRAVAGGVNQFVLHGQTYSGNYYNTTWPGYTPFSYTFSEIYSEKQPVWKHGLSEALGYIARVQFVQQKGTPRVDLAIYNKVSASNPNFPTLYQVESLVKSGWSYEYLTADNLHLPQARVEGQKLAPDGPQYKGIVLPDSSNLTLEAVSVLKSFAEAGLPIVISGSVHGYYHSGDGSGEAAVQSAISDLLKTERVYSAESQDLPQILSSIGLDPQIRAETNATLYTTWREDVIEGIDYAFLFCDGSSCRGSFHISSTKRPYFLDPWDGQRTPVLKYSLVNNKTVLPLNLRGNETIIVAFAGEGLEDVLEPTFHATETPSNLIGYRYENENKLNIQLGPPTSAQPRITLSTGKSIPLGNLSSHLSTIQLRNWTLTAEHWDAPPNINDASATAAKHNTTHALPSLTSWTSIPGLENASGVGRYATSFHWPPPGGADGARIRFSHVLHAVTVRVNGHRLPPLDCSAPEADVGPHLVAGVNEVVVVVPTTMWNYLRSIFSRLVHVGEAPLLGVLARFEGGELPPRTENGLVGMVELRPYVSCVVEV